METRSNEPGEILNKIPSIRIPKIRLRPSRGIKILILACIMLVFSFHLFFIYVEPDEFGIKVIRIGINRGVQRDFYGAGLHFVIPGFQQMHRLPREIQVLELTGFPSSASDSSRKDRVAHIQTSDGFFVDVDVSILYRISDPYLVFTTIGPGELFEDNGILPKAEPALKETLGKLTTEDFYNSPLRSKKTLEARDKLNEELKPKGIRVEQVLVRYFKYSHEIQKNIEEKKLKDQLVFTNQAAARAATEEADLKRIVQEGQVKLEVEMEKGRAYVTRKLAEKELYLRAKKAEADLLVKLADAEKVRLKNEAMKGVGSERMVGLKMADAYKGLDLIVLPSDGPAGVNPLDLGNALKLFDVRKGGAQ